jgi:hypothetical protein
MGNLPALLLNATPLVSRFFAEMSKKRQRRVIVNLDNKKSFRFRQTLQISTVIVIIPE